MLNTIFLWPTLLEMVLSLLCQLNTMQIIQTFEDKLEFIFKVTENRWHDNHPLQMPNSLCYY